MYFVGVDITKFKRDCAVLDEVGGPIKPSWSFANDHEGFFTLRDFLNSLEGEKRIGPESTGHYGQNLKLFFESDGFTFVEFNPLLIFRSRKSLRNTTNDSISAQNIARYVMTVEYKPYPPSSSLSSRTSASSRTHLKCFPLPAWNRVTFNPASLSLLVIWLNTVPPSSGMPS